MKKSHPPGGRTPYNTQDIELLKDKATEGLLKKVWNRLSDLLLHRFWFPPKRHLVLDADEWKRQHDEVSKSLRRTMLTLLGYCFFCTLTLAAPDASLIAKDAIIKVPFAGIEVSYQAFLIIGPLTMFALVIYAHILLGHWLSIGKHKDTFGLPYIFNIDSKAANWLANFIFYWLPCLVLAHFYWKALPRPTEAKLLITQTAIFFTCMVVLRIRRFPDGQYRVIFNALYLFGWLLGVCFLLGPQIEGHHRSLDLFRADLINKDLRNTYLSKANLVEADLNGADLRGASLSNADLSGADLSGASLSGASLSDADLSGAILTETKQLSGADLSGVNLSGANLSGADLSGADLLAVNLSGANLSGADLSGADLLAVNLSEADLSGADLSGARLSKADLSGAILTEAILTEARLSGAILTETKQLTVEQLCKASVLYEAKLEQELETQVKQECPDLLKNPDEKK